MRAARISAGTRSVDCRDSSCSDALRDRPEREKAAWKNVIEYYVFGPAGRAGEHLPEQARGVLGAIDETRARQIRAMLLSWLNR